MGMQQYLNKIRQANRGVDLAAEDTEMALDEGGESEIPTNDPEVNLAAPASDCSQVSSTFQSELYEALMRRSNADVTDYQNLLLQLLSLVNGTQPVPRNLKIQYFTAAADRLPLMANRQPETNPTVADRYREYSHLLRDMAHLWNNFFQYRDFKMKSKRKPKEYLPNKISHAAEYWQLRITRMPVCMPLQHLDLGKCAGAVCQSAELIHDSIHQGGVRRIVDNTHT